MAEDAVREMNGYNYNGRRLAVEFSKPRNDGKPSDRGRGSSGGPGAGGNRGGDRGRGPAK